jgi:hypothetical protein
MITYILSTNNKRPPGGVCFSKKIAISAGARSAAAAILLGYNLKVNDVRTTLFGVSDLKKSSGDVVWIVF